MKRWSHNWSARHCGVEISGGTDHTAHEDDDLEPRLLGPKVVKVVDLENANACREKDVGLGPLPCGVEQLLGVE